VRKQYVTLNFYYFKNIILFIYKSQSLFKILLGLNQVVTINKLTKLWISF